MKTQVLGQAIDTSISDVGSVDECAEPDTEQPREYVVYTAVSLSLSDSIVESSHNHICEESGPES